MLASYQTIHSVILDEPLDLDSLAPLLNFHIFNACTHVNVLELRTHFDELQRALTCY